MNWKHIKEVLETMGMVLLLPLVLVFYLVEQMQIKKSGVDPYVESLGGHEWTKEDSNDGM